MKSFFAVLALVAATNVAHAALLDLEKGSNAIENVNIAKAAIAHVNSQDIRLDGIGAGVRTKKVAIVNVKVYVAQVLSSDASKFVRKDDGALKSLDESRTTAIQLSFLRTVEAEKVQVSFRDALVANKVDLNNVAISKFLKAVNDGGDAQEGKSLTIVNHKLADREILAYETTSGKQTIIEGQLGLGRQIMAIWLGAPADDGIAKLKEQILSSK